MAQSVEWDTDPEPETIGTLVKWFEEAENHLTEGPDVVDYISTRWVYLIEKVAEAQGVPPGWLAYMISTLAVEDALA